MSYVIGSARADEKGALTGGKSGDQKQKSAPDFTGEVSLQTFYVHKKGWYVLRPILKEHALKIAERMFTACNNDNVGYNQGDRLGVVKNGIDTKKLTACDCSALVRECIKEATGKDPGNFTTADEANKLEKSGLFNKRIKYTASMPLYTGDVLVTCTRGHTVIVTEGEKRQDTAPAATTKPAAVSKSYYKAFTGNTPSITVALSQIGVDNSFNHRKKIAAANGITNYAGTAAQNTQLLRLLKAGKLIKA